MAYNPTPEEPAPHQEALNLDEAPTQQYSYNPDEAPTQRRPLPRQGFAAQQPENAAPTPQGSQPPEQQAGYPSPQQAEYLPPQPGGYAPQQQPAYPPPPPEGYGQAPQASYPPAQPGNYPPAQPGYYPPNQGAGSPYPQQRGYAPPPQTPYPPAQQGYPIPPGINREPLAGQQAPGAPLAGAASAEPYSQYVSPQPGQPGAPAAARPGAGAFDARKFWRDLTLLGQVEGIAGILLVIFFFLPWLYAPDFASASINNPTGGHLVNIPTVSYSGWHVASSLPLFAGNVSISLFPHLWLVLVSALALIVLAVLLGFGRIRPRVAAILMTALALFALLLEVLFLVQANSIQSFFEALVGGALNQQLYGVSWGFWISLAITVVALGVGVYMLLQAYVPGMARRPNRPQFPGSQQPTPTA